MAENPIRYEDFFDPSDEALVKDIITNIKTLDSVYTTTVNNIKGQNDALNTSLRVSAAELLNAVQRLNVGSESERQSLQKLTQQVEELVIARQQLITASNQQNSSMQQSQQQVTDLANRTQSLVAATKSLNISDKDAANAKKVLMLQAQQLKNEQLALTNALLDQKKASDLVVLGYQQQEAASKAATAASKAATAAAQTAASTAPPPATSTTPPSTTAAPATTTGAVGVQIPATPLIQAEMTAYEQLAQTLVFLRTELAAVNQKIKENTAAFTGGLIAEEEYTAIATQLTTEQARLNQQITITRANFVQQTRETLGEVGAYELLNREYQAAAINAKNLSVQYGIQSAQARAATATAAGLHAELLAIDQSVGQSQRNVGNYFGAFSRGFAFLRTAAAILPGIGLQGIFLLLYEGLSKIVTALFETVPAFNASKEAHRNWVATVQDAQQSSEREIINLRVMERAATDVNLPMTTRVNIVKQMQAEYPNYLGNLSQEAIISGQAAEQVQSLADALFKKALMEAEANKAAQLGIKNLELQDQQRFLYDEQAQAQAKINELIAKRSKAGTANSESAEARSYSQELANAQGHLSDINKLMMANGQEQQSLNSQIALYINDIAKSQALLETFSKGASLGGATENVKNFLTQLLKAQQDGEDLLLQDQIKFHQSIADSDKFAYSQRMTELQKASNLRLQLIEQNRDSELAQNSQAEAEALKQLNGDEAKANAEYANNIGKKNADTKKLEENRNKIVSEAALERNIAEAAFEQQRKNIITKAEFAIRDEQIKAITTLADFRKAAMEQEIADTKKQVAELDAAQQKQFDLVKTNTNDSTNKFDTGRAIQYNADLSKLNDAYRKGEIKKYEDYIKQKEDLDAAYNRATIGSQINSTEALIANLKTVPNRTKEQNDYILKLEEDLVKAKKALYEDDANNFKRNSDKKKKTAEEEKEIRQNIIKASFDLAATAITGLNDLEQAYTDTSISRLEKQKEDEINMAGNNAAAKDAINQKYAKKEADLKRKAAIADKLAAIFNIAISTAQGVANATSKVTTIPLIPFIIGTGILEAAIVAAKPIPAFWRGGKMDKTGLALVGEKGIEAVESKDGQVTLTGNKAHYMYLREGDRIYQASAPETSFYKDVFASAAAEGVKFDTSVRAYNAIADGISTAKTQHEAEVIMRAMNSASMNVKSLHFAFKDAVKDIPVQEHRFDLRGYSNYTRRRNNLIEDINKRNAAGGQG